jgi:hypothetical protein
MIESVSQYNTYYHHLPQDLSNANSEYNWILATAVIYDAILTNDPIPLIYLF